MKRDTPYPAPKKIFYFINQTLNALLKGIYGSLASLKPYFDRVIVTLFIKMYINHIRLK